MRQAATRLSMPSRLAVVALDPKAGLNHTSGAIERQGWSFEPSPRSYR
jgi:hypothetical protein